MRLTAIGLPKTRRFSTSKAALKRAFADVDDLSVHMGSLGRVFKFDFAVLAPPGLDGQRSSLAQCVARADGDPPGLRGPGVLTWICRARGFRTADTSAHAAVAP